MHVQVDLKVDLSIMGKGRPWQCHYEEYLMPKGPRQLLWLQSGFKE